MSANSNLTGLSPNNPLKYLGPNVSLNVTVSRNRAPTGADYRQPETGKLYPFLTWWLVGKNPTTGVEGDLWYLSKIVGNVAYWLQFTGGGGGGGNPLLLTVDSVSAPGVNPVIQNPGGGMIFRGATAANSGVPVSTNSPTPFTYDLVVQRATTNAVTSASLNGVCHFNSTDFTVDANGFVSSIASNIEFIQVQNASAPGVNPVLPSGMGGIVINGALVNNTSIPLQTISRAANALNVEAQVAAASAGSDRTKNGLAHFDSAVFAINSDGFVTTIGGGAGIERLDVQANVVPGTDPVVPNAGTLVLNGALINQAGLPIRTISRAANTASTEVQVAGSGNASDRAKNGLAHFDSDAFLVDADGFVSLIGGGAGIERIDVQASSPPGTDPVVPNAGTLVLEGELVAQQGIPIRTISKAANTVTNEVQIGTAAGASDASKNGLAHFNSADFTVDANGFVSSVASVGPSPGAILTLSDDFTFLGYSIANGASNGELDWTTSSSTPFAAGTSNPPIAQLDPDHPGIGISYGTLHFGSNAWFLLGGWKENNITLGGGELTIVWVAYIYMLSEPLQRYELRLGAGDSNSALVGNPQSNAIYFTYSDTLNSGNWTLTTINNSSISQVATSIPVTTGWHTLKLVVNAAGTSVVFTIDGVAQPPVVSNIPTGPITGYYGLIPANTAIGSNYPDGLIQLDLFYLNLILTNPRVW